MHVEETDCGAYCKSGLEGCGLVWSLETGSGSVLPELWWCTELTGQDGYLSGCGLVGAGQGVFCYVGLVSSGRRDIASALMWR